MKGALRRMPIITGISFWTSALLEGIAGFSCPGGLVPFGFPLHKEVPSRCRVPCHTFHFESTGPFVVHCTQSFLCPWTSHWPQQRQRRVCQVDFHEKRNASHIFPFEAPDNNLCSNICCSSRGLCPSLGHRIPRQRAPHFHLWSQAHQRSAHADGSIAASCSRCGSNTEKTQAGPSWPTLGLPHVQEATIAATATAWVSVSKRACLGRQVPRSASHLSSSQ